MEINNFLERLLAVSPDTITLLVLVGCLLLFGLSFPFKRLRDIAPALMVSAGIIGTFWGTFIALGDFQTGAESGGGLDHQAMVESIPKVLGGMKSAFVTSLIGLFFGFGSKIGFRLIPEKMQDALPHEKDALNLLRDIKSGISGEGDKSLSSQIERLQAEYRVGASEIKQSIDGGGDSSIATQLTRLRNENSDGFKNSDARLAGLANAEQTKAMMDELRGDLLPPLTEATGSLGAIKEGIAGDGDSSVVSRLAQLRGDNNLGFQQLDSRVKDTASDTLNALNQVKEGIAGDGDSSVVSRLSQLKEENSRGFAKLDSQLKGLADTIIDAVLKGLVKQMEETNKILRQQLGDMIERIEEALIRQFGETFKQFNEATQAIKKWQEDHRAHVEQLTAAFQTAAAGITRIRADCESIPATMEQLRALMGELDERLRAFADMKKSAEESFPVIKAHLDSIGEDLRKSAAGFSGLEETINRTYEQAAGLAQQHIATAQSHIENVGTEINRTAAQLAEAAGGMITESRAAAAQHQEAIQAAANEMQNALATLTENMQKQFSDSAEEIKTAAENMISESRNASVQQREEIQNIINNAQASSQRCIEEMQATLTQMAEQHAQTTNDAMAEIARRWGENMVGIANELQRIIQEQR